MNAITNQKDILNFSRNQYTQAVKAYYGYTGDRTDDTGTELLNSMIEARDTMITAALEYVKFSQYFTSGAVALNNLRDRVKKSPTARNLFIDEIMAWELS